MDITWLGHSSFRLQSGSTVWLTDPFAASLGMDFPSIKDPVTVATVSNSHPHHNAVEGLPKEAVSLTMPGEFEIAGLYAKGIRTPLLLPPSGQPEAAWNTVFTVVIEGLVVCHLGDLGGPLSSRLVDELSSPHVMLVPVGGHCTLSPMEAADLVNTLAPRIVIPMHYAYPGVNVELEPLGVFLRELGIAEPEAQSRLTITRSGLPEEMQLVSLRPAFVS